jgi:hypothetical protein
LFSNDNFINGFLFNSMACLRVPLRLTDKPLSVCRAARSLRRHQFSGHNFTTT